MDTSSLMTRMIRASKLDVEFYQEVEHDPSLDGQAVSVVIIAAIAAGVGSLLGGIISSMFGGLLGNLSGTDVGLGFSFATVLLSTVWVTVFTLIGYYIWAFVTHWVGTKLFEGDADFGEVKRTLGYAYSPQVLSFFSFIPCLGPLLALVGSIWSLVAAFFAIREALDLDTAKTVITIAVGWVVIMIISFIVTAIIGGAGLLASGALG